MSSSKDRGSPFPEKRLRMDARPQPSRINDPSLPMGKRKEIDNVMKKARACPNSDNWDRRLLEAEERDPNRWRHSGYKKLYVDDSPRGRTRSRSRSPRPVRRHRSPPPRKIRTPEPVEKRKLPPPSPPPPSHRRRVPSPIEKRKMHERRPLTPPSPLANRGRGSNYRSSSSSSDSDTPPPPPKSKNNRPRARSPPPRPPARSERYARSPSVEEASRTPVKRHRPVEKVPEKHRERVVPSAYSDEVVAKPKKSKHKSREKTRHTHVRIKVEGEPKKRPRTPSSASDDSSSSGDSVPPVPAVGTRMTLSERFGKIAQWSVDRSNMENMRITKNSAGGNVKVMIGEEPELMPPMDQRYAPVRPAGHFPEELMTDAPHETNWDDVRVRYDFYKDQGYLRNISLKDYIKWEEWWYRYQEWLDRCAIWEREKAMARRPRKRPIAQRLN